MNYQLPTGEWAAFDDDMSEADIKAQLARLYPPEPPGVTVHEANRSYIAGSPTAPYVNTTGMDQAQRAEAARALEMRRSWGFGGGTPSTESPMAQDPRTGQWAPYTPPSLESAIPAFQGATYHLGDELLSAGAGAGSWLRGGGFGETYNTTQEAQRQALAQQREQHPTRSGLLEVGGALATAPWASVLGAGRGVPLIGQIAGGGLTGGLLGGVEGFGSGSGFSDRLGQAETGAAVGAGMGAGIPAVAGAGRGVLDYLGDLFAGPGKRALNIIGKDLQADVRAGGPGPGDIVRRMETSPSTVLPVDVAGENVRGRVGEAARIPGPGRQQIAETLDTRDVQAPRVLSGAVDTMATGSPGTSTFMAERMLEQQAKTDASPLYGKAFMAPALNPDHAAPGGELNELMKRPSMRTAARSALNIAQEQGVNPNSLGITFNEAGDPIFQAVPSWRTLDYMKQGIDSALKPHKNPITGAIEGAEGYSTDATRRQFIDFLDRNNPDYAPARAAYSGPYASKEALTDGSRVFNKSPDQIAYELAQLSPSDQQFYRLGAANALKTDLAKTSSGGNEALKLIGNQNRQDQLKAVFPNADPLLEVANAEKLKFGTQRDLLGGSDTARRVAQDASGDGGLLSNAFQMALNYATAGLAGKSVQSGIKDIVAQRGMSPEVANEIAGRLLQSDPTLARAWLQNAFDKGGRSGWRPLY